MATFLHWIGRTAFERRRLVLLFWVIVLAAVGAAAAHTTGGSTSSFTLPGTEAQRANDLLSEKFPAANAGGATARVVLRAPHGEKITSTGNRASVAATLKDLAASSSRVGAVSDPFTSGTVSEDGATAYTTVAYRSAAADLTDRDHERFDDALHEGRETGLTVEASGNAVATTEEGTSAEAIGFALAAVILLLTLGSWIAAGLPLLTAVIGVGISLAALTALGPVFDLNSNTSALASMLGIAVGIDYALFIVSRYRSERAAGHDAREAVGRANGTAGSAVVFAGLTVMIALVGLAVVNLPVLTAMGIAAAGAVAVAVLVAITLVPAMLGFAPERVRGRSRDRAVGPGGRAAEAPHGSHDTQAPRDSRDAKAARGSRDTQASRGSREATPFGRRWAEAVVRRPVRVLVTAVAALAVIALPATGLELGLPDDGSQPPSTTQRRAYDMLAQSFGEGFNGPLTVVVADQSAATAKKAAATMYAKIRELDDVALATPAVFNPSGDTAIISVIPDSAPSGDATKDLVTGIRSLAATTENSIGARSMVTGTTALNIDISDKFSAALMPYLLVVVGLAVLVLILVFRSLLVPLKAALGFLLSVLASLGAVVAVFQWGWLKDLFGIEQTGPIMSLMPILTVGIVFGLAMDYQVFLVTRIRESYVHSADPRQAISTGFQHSAKVITAAALIMICVFAGFIGSTESVIAALGFGLAVAVALDAFIVRMTIVPAVLALLGHRAWSLPAWIDRVLPNVDIEGEQLTKSPTADARPEPATELSTRH
ncbi:MMPL family transporter [Streptomyces malaysiensis subsp. malaysiensis]|uniref:MMPL family transporter n=1 Tax=Streptomyces malaysiensis TaxID=92644 RepID=A0ABX6W872_STRMQ|nr:MULTISPECIES: MMPL family transporter [Streptomyces]QPI55946.1 MMPL family transporter [Streptomyces solisilvae]UHH17417.1 MMPL family transporter [Streptomyces sp. HNM0561]